MLHPVQCEMIQQKLTRYLLKPLKNKSIIQCKKYKTKLNAQDYPILKLRFTLYALNIIMLMY